MIRLILCFFIITPSFASNHNDLKKARVIRYFEYKASEVLEELSRIQEIFEISGKEVDLKYLRTTLSETKIEVSEKNLVDNTGSIVDVIGEPNHLVLHLDTWINFQKQDYDLRPLIIHELLRISSINDDDYLVSRPLYSSLSSTNKENEKQTPYCNLRVSKTMITTSKKKFSGEGFEPLNDSGRMIINTVSGPNLSYKNAIKDVKEKCEKAGYYGYQYISGQTKWERRNSNGFVRMEKKTSIKAYCFKDKIKKRKKKEIRKESCKKLKQCEEVFNSAPEGQVDQDSIRSLESFKKENKCAS